jgi:NAD-dependent dihydropyrimidine dehydrogenase PreA subunit
MIDKPTYSVSINQALCTGCGNCVNACPTDVFEIHKVASKAYVSYPKDCHVCFLCVPDCPVSAIAVTWDALNHRQVSVYATLDFDPVTLLEESQP